MFSSRALACPGDPVGVPGVAELTVQRVPSLQTQQQGHRQDEQKKERHQQQVNQGRPHGISQPTAAAVHRLIPGQPHRPQQQKHTSQTPDEVGKKVMPQAIAQDDPHQQHDGDLNEGIAARGSVRARRQSLSLGRLVPSGERNRRACLTGSGIGLGGRRGGVHHGSSGQCPRRRAANQRKPGRHATELPGFPDRLKCQLAPARPRRISFNSSICRSRPSEPARSRTGRRRCRSRPP